jgi:peptidyl-tRNA hydrolase, PTH1 family
LKIVVGLGNPGKQYAETRHNVGWMVLDRIAERAGRAGRGKERDASSVVQLRYRGLDLVLVKPLTYMNASGTAVRKVLARERAPLEDLLVVVDDFALPLGRLRLREQGSAGGHNGLRSIIGDLGSQRFARLRVGIGEPSRQAVDHVLSRFATDERATVERVVDAAADAVEDWARDGVGLAANRWNAWSLPGGPPVDEPGGSTGTPARDAGDSAGPPTAGVVRTRTGWRKLLPGVRHDDASGER